MARVKINIKDGTIQKNDRVIGIDLGTTNSLIALVDAEGHELVWLETLSQTSEANRELIMEELAMREFMPVLTKIENVSTFATPSVWDVETSRGRTRFVLKGEDDIRRVNKTMFLVSDNHGVQYLIKDILALDKHSRRLLDRFL